MSASQHHRQLTLEARAHSMRQAPSEPERMLWQLLRSSQLGLLFRRQVVIGAFIVDFFAPSARLVVEVDGSHHARRRTADKRRDRALRQLGLTVLRLPAQLVLREPVEALRLIRAACR